MLAIVKLKEEEMEKNNSFDKSTGVDTDDDDDHDVEHAPKITRSKAKVLNKKILPITAPSEPSEASMLIQAELGSDDEDEEYEPGNEDVHVSLHFFFYFLVYRGIVKTFFFCSRMMNTTHLCQT